MTWELLAGGSKSLAEFGLTWLCQSSALLALGLLAGRQLRRQGPAVQSAAYRTTLVAVLVCPVASALLARAGFDGITLRLAVAEPEVAPAPVPISVSVATATIEPIRPIELPRRPPMILAESPPIDVPPPTVEAPSKLHLPEIHWLAAGVATGLSGWLLGLIVMATRLAVGLRAMARLRGSAIPADPEAKALCLEVADRMGLSAPEVLRAPFLHSPCVDGLRRPAILLPDDPGVDLRDTFVHELAHLARRDVWWNLLRHSSTALLWFQPLLWVLSRRMEVTAEEVCDDYVVQLGGDRANYAGLLLGLAERSMPPASATAVGMVSLRSLLSRRIVRILDSSRDLSTRAGTRALFLMLLAGLAGTLTAGLLGVGEPRTSAAGAEAGEMTDRPETSGTRTVAGRVVDADGRPIAGATVTAARFSEAGIGPYGSDRDRQGLERAVADADGRFTLRFEDLDPATLEAPSQRAMVAARVMVVALAPGGGPAWAALPKSVGNDTPLTLTVPRDDLPIDGRLVDLEGRPVAGATVKVARLYRSQDPGAIDRWRATLAQGYSGTERPRSHYFPIANERALPGSDSALPAPVVTDAAGRFRIEGLGRDRLAILEVTGPSAAYRCFEVVTRTMPRIEGRRLDDPGVVDSTYHGAEATLVVAPSRPVEGIVRDADSKKPIPYATITAEAQTGDRIHIGGLITTSTDADGRYRLVGLPKGKGNELGVYPGDQQPYFVTHHLAVPETPGIGPVGLDIELKRGIWITGKVTDVKTGDPVLAEVHYDPLLANRNAQGFANFNPNRMSIPSRGEIRFSDKDGQFRVVGLPGRGLLEVKSVDRAYRLGFVAEGTNVRMTAQSIRVEALPTYGQARPDDFQMIAEVDPPPGQPEFRRDLALDPGPTLEVQLVDPEGKPAPGAGAWGRYPEGLDDGNNDLWGSRTKVAVDPKAPKTVVFYHRGRKLAATLLVKPGDERAEGTRTVALRPCPVVAGRLVDAEGKPASGVISIHATNREDLGPGISHVEVATDEHGRFRVADLPPTFHYTIRAKDRGEAADQGRPKRFRNFDLSRALALEPAQVLDLGTFEVTTGRRVEAP